MKAVALLIAIALGSVIAVGAQRFQQPEFAVLADPTLDIVVWSSIEDRAKQHLISAGNDQISVYTLHGDRLQSVALDGVHSLDIRYGVQFNNRSLTLLAVGVESDRKIQLYEIAEPSGELVSLGEISSTLPNNGLCMVQTDDAINIVVTSAQGEMEQIRVDMNDAGQLIGWTLRLYRVGESLAGCVADEALGVLYLNEPGVNIWKYCAEAEHGEMVDISFALKYGLDYDRERERNSLFEWGTEIPTVNNLTLITTGETTGYLVATPHDGDLYVFDRGAENDSVGPLAIGLAVDGLASSSDTLVAATADGIHLLDWTEIAARLTAPN